MFSKTLTRVEIDPCWLWSGVYGISQKRLAELALFTQREMNALNDQMPILLDTFDNIDD